MKAQAQGFSYLKRDRQYRIPFFQRNYVWDEDNWEEFYDSIIDSIITNKSAFLGSIIIKDTGNKKWDKAIFNIIDGQQRLTTISLFIKAFVDEKISGEDRNFYEYINTLYIYENKTSENNDLKIIHSNLDRNEFQKCINSKYTENFSSVNNESKIFLCYKYFREKIQNTEPDIIDKMKEIILNAENELYNSFVLIEIDSDENEQKIFDTVNSSGVRLTSSDIIKNAIFEKIMELSDNEEKVVELYNKTWNKTFIKDEETLKYWESENVSGRIKRERIEVLLHSIAIIKKIFNPNKNKILDLSDQYKKFISGMDEKTIIDFVHEICELATLYKEKFIDFDKGHNFSMNEREEVFHKILDMFDSSSFNPYILDLYYKNKKGEINEKDLLDKFLKLEKYIARTLICNTGSNKNFNKINADLIENNPDIKIETLLQNEEINDIAFRNSLTKIKNNKYGRIFLYILMLKRLENEDGKGSMDSLQFIFTLEHIMPTSYQEHWDFNAVPLDKLNSEGEPLSDEEKKEYRQNSILQLGNMTLLKQPLNAKIKNSSFKIKLEGKENKRGIKDYHQLSICSEIFDIEVWNESEIELRTKKLANELLSIW